MSDAYDARMTGRVQTPHGQGMVLSYSGDGQYLVMFSKGDYSPDEWRKISPANGPCVFRIYPGTELERLG